MQWKSPLLLPSKTADSIIHPLSASPMTCSDSVQVKSSCITAHHPVSPTWSGWQLSEGEGCPDPSCHQSETPSSWGNNVRLAWSDAMRPDIPGLPCHDQQTARRHQHREMTPISMSKIHDHLSSKEEGFAVNPHTPPHPTLFLLPVWVHCLNYCSQAPFSQNNPIKTAQRNQSLTKNAAPTKCRRLWHACHKVQDIST